MDRLDCPETLDQLRNMIQTASWFSCLGNASDSDRSALWVNAESWKHHIGFATAVELGLSSTNYPRSLPDYKWLPTSVYQEDPIHQGDLLQKISSENKADLLNAARRELSQTTLVSLRSMIDAPLLTVGATSLAESAKGAALFAVRMATIELVSNQSDFWCKLIPLYHAGHWPFGRSTKGNLLLIL